MVELYSEGQSHSSLARTGRDHGENSPWNAGSPRGSLLAILTLLLIIPFLAQTCSDEYLIGTKTTQTLQVTDLSL